ncbi:MAG TPA: hypothetical protein EYP07_14825 [Kiloniellaceae bacterium]|nr:hypothetical protein [Kiloniellaceae bacterium]
MTSHYLGHRPRSLDECEGANAVRAEMTSLFLQAMRAGQLIDEIDLSRFTDSERAAHYTAAVYAARGAFLEEQKSRA